MTRTAALSLAALTLVLLLLPLTARKPGLPVTLKADEPAYFLAALSLARDGDLRCETKDLRRLFDFYPYTGVRNLILMSDDGWRTFYFGKPYPLALFAAPFAALWGPNGVIAFNMALLLAMVWMGATYLRRFNDEAPALLFAAGFFLCSTSFTYVFWLHPEVLMMFSTTACLFLGLRPRPESPQSTTDGRVGWRRWLWHPEMTAFGSGAALAIGTYHKPMMAVLGLPVLFFLLRRRRFVGLGLWLAGAVLAMSFFAGLAVALTGHPTAYLGVERAGFTIQSPERPPIEPLPMPTAEEEVGSRSAGWWWILQVPKISWGELREDLVYFFVGRHTGLFLYQPFALVALGLFLLWGRRSATRWVLAASIALVALFFLILIPFNWHGGGGFVGNRYFILAYPAFLFLVTTIRPLWATVAGFALGGLFVAPLVLSPFGIMVPYPTLQAHVRNLPFQTFPFELSLFEMPGYMGEVDKDVWFRGRREQVRKVGDAFWVQGADTVEVWMQSAVPLADLTFAVTSPVKGNRVTLAMGSSTVTLEAGPGPQRVVLSPTHPSKLRRERDPTDYGTVIPFYAYRLMVTSTHGVLPHWLDLPGPQSFFLGAELRYLGADGAAEEPDG